MWRDQREFIAWSVHQINRSRLRFAAVWERLILGILRASSVPLLRIAGARLAWTLALNETDEEDLDALNAFAFGDF